MTDDIAAGWVLRLLDQDPTAERIAGAQRAGLKKIPHLSTEQAQALHQAAGQSVATLPHVQVVTIPGIGAATAAALVAKIVDIDRFATPNHLVNYFGVFPTL